MENFARIYEKYKARLEERAVDNPEPISLRVGKPLLEAASMESNDELQDLWARLMANAMDPNRDVILRHEFIDVLSQFEPIDVLILETAIENYVIEQDDGLRINSFALSDPQLNHIDSEVLAVGIANLVRMRCLQEHDYMTPEFSVTPLGRLLVRACRL